MKKIIFNMIGAIIVGAILSYELGLTPFVGGLLAGGLYWLAIN